MKPVDPTIAIESKPSTSTTSSCNTLLNHNQVRVLPKEEYKQAALCLAEAFKDDDVAMYFVKTGDRKKTWTDQQGWNLHLHIIECITMAHCLKGLVTCVGPNYDCVALWMKPGKNMDDFLTMLRSRMLFLRCKLSTEGNKRFFTEFIPLLHDTKHDVLGKYDDDSWYLVYIGTKPGSRGKGYAKTLIEYTTKQADTDRRPSYLECSNPRNLKLYNRLGFRMVKTIYLQRGDKPVELDIMTRPPGALPVSVRKEPEEAK